MKSHGRDPKSISDLERKIERLSLENDNLKERVTELELFNSINLSLSNTLDREETFESIRQFFQTTFSIDQFLLLLRTGAEGELEIVSSFGSRLETGQYLEVKTDNSIFSTVLKTGEAVYIADCKKKTDYDCPKLHRSRVGSHISLPLIIPSDHVIGVLSLHRRQIDGFATSEITRLSHLANHVAMVIDKTLLFHQTKMLSITDPLTGIYNRRYFDERFSREATRAIRYQRAISILMIDIDHFKKYNDTLGHLMGDVALKRLAGVLSQRIRRADVLARYGGEEFVILLPELHRSNAKIVAEKLRAAIEEETFEGEDKLPSKKVTISVGAASFPEDTDSPENLTQLADEALYDAKKSGRNCFRQP